MGGLPPPWSRVVSTGSSGPHWPSIVVAVAIRLIVPRRGRPTVRRLGRPSAIGVSGAPAIHGVIVTPSHQM